MRKKYLSALLFGALLFASAGTFTSCKDYDDDINNLQEQINTIKTDLESLKATVDGLDGVKTLSFVDGTLIIETGKGTKVEVPVPSATDVEQTTVKLDGQNLVVNGEVIGQVGDKVTVNEDGYLCVNGKATEIKAGKYAILENESDNTYTISLPDAEGNMHTITLLKSVATNITISYWYYTGAKCDATGEMVYSGYPIFTEINPTISTENAQKIQTENGIAWGVATSDIDWKGPKGPVKAGQLLIGQQNEISIVVTPKNVDLSKQSLKLVDASGKEAPVIVTPYIPYNDGNATTGSRAESNNGVWNLKITMDNTITADNIGKAFAQITDQSGDFDVWANKVYALQVNGDLATGYTFVIDTDEDKCKMQGKDELKYVAENIKLDWGSATNSQFTDIALNSEHYLTIEQGSVYDYKFEIVNADENDAEAWGITLENNVLKATDAAAGQTIHLNVKLLGVNGVVKDLELTNKSTNTIAVTFGQIKSSAITLPVSTYKVTPVEYANSQTTGTDKKYATVVLDMGDLFSGLTAQEAIAVKKGETALTTTDETFAFLRKTIVATKHTEDVDIYFYKADGTTRVKFDDDEANIRDIKYAKVIYNAPGNETLWNKKATLGEHILRMTLKDASGNEIRKANIPVNVTIPSFFELFTKSGAWTESTALTVVNKNGTIDLKQLYNDKTSIKNAYFDKSSTFIADSKVAGTVPGTENTVTLKAEAVNNSHNLKDVATELVYKIVPECPNFWVTSGKFTMDLVTKLDAAKFIYYGADGKETDIIVRPESKNTIAAWKFKDKVNTGLSFYKAGENNVFKNDEDPNGFTLEGVTGENAANLDIKFDDKAGDLADAYFDANGNLIVSGLAKGNYTTILTVTYKKAVEFGNTTVHETFQIPLNVQGVE